MTHLQILQQDIYDFITLVEANGRMLSDLVIGGYIRSPASMGLTEKIGSALASTDHLPAALSFGTLATTDFFIRDAKNTLTDLGQFANMIQLWEPILKRLMVEISEHNNVNDQIMALQKLPYAFASFYDKVDQEQLHRWFYRIQKIYANFSYFKKNLEEITNQARQELSFPPQPISPSRTPNFSE